MAKMESALGQEYAKALDARALGEIASWCEMAAKGLSVSQASEKADRARYLQTAMLLRDLAENATRRSA